MLIKSIFNNKSIYFIIIENGIELLTLFFFFDFLLSVIS